MTEKLVAIVQARMGSERLPGKVLKPLSSGFTLIDCHLERLKRSRAIKRIIVATTTDQDDNVLVQHLEDRGVEVFRGSHHDVLDRYYRCAKNIQADYILRTTSDCPLIDPRLIDGLASEYFLAPLHLDYADISHKCIPRGFDAEIVTYGALEKAFNLATDASEREHVLPFIWKRPDNFKVHSYRPNIKGSDLRLCVDEPEDLKLIEQIFSKMPSVSEKSCEEVIAFLRKNPSFTKINKDVLQKSL